MPARSNPEQKQKTIDRIKVTLIVKRLMDHILDEDGIMNASQVRAAEILLKKVVPDLAHTAVEVEHSFIDDLSERLAMARQISNDSRLNS